MKRIIPIIVLLLMGCASAPQKWAVEKIVVTTYTENGKLEEHRVPVVPFNFWSTLVDIGKKAGGL